MHASPCRERSTTTEPVSSPPLITRASTPNFARPARIRSYFCGSAILLIFTLCRPDVLPVDDFGVRDGFRIAYGRREQPTPKQLSTFGERWKPYRSVAARYLWMVANEAKRTK